MDDTTRAPIVERQVTIPILPKEAWRWWTEPGLIVRWMGSTAEIDLRPGGTLRIAYANGAAMAGAFVAVEAPRHLEFTWGWEDPAEAVGPGASRVELQFDDADGAATTIRLRHHDLPKAEMTSHAEGWDYFLGRLHDAVS